MEQMHHEKIGGERFLQELSLLRGEVRKLFVHFAGHQVSDFKAKMHRIRFRLGLRPTQRSPDPQNSHKILGLPD